MALNKMERVVLEGEAREIYERYQHRKTQIERVIREKIEREIAAEQGDALRDLSKALHDFHRRGLPKSALRVATKKYGNNDEFLKLWNAYTPEEEFTLAVGRSAVPIFEWKNTVLYVHRNPATTATLEHSIAVPLYNRTTWYQGAMDTDIEPEINAYMGGRKEGFELYRAVTREIERAFEDGNITESTHPYDYVNDLPEEQQSMYLETEERKNFTLNPWINKESN